MAGSPAISQSRPSQAVIVEGARRLSRADAPRTLDAALDRIDELEETVRQLLENISGRSQICLPASFGFTRKMEDILTMMLTRPHVTREQLMMGVYGLEEDPPEPKIFDVFICKIRRRLKEMDVEIETLWGRGWMISPENKVRLREIIVFFGGTVNDD